MSRITFLTVISSVIVCGITLYIQARHHADVKQLIIKENERVIELEATLRAQSTLPDAPPTEEMKPFEERYAASIEQIEHLIDGLSDVLDIRTMRSTTFDVLHALKSLTVDEILKLADGFTPTTANEETVWRHLYFIVAAQQPERIFQREDLMRDLGIAMHVVKMIARSNPEAALRWIKESEWAAGPPNLLSLSILYETLNHHLDRGIDLIRQIRDRDGLESYNSYSLPLHLERLPELATALRDPKNQDMKADITRLMLNSAHQQAGLTGLREAMDFLGLGPNEMARAVNFDVHEPEEIVEWLSEDDCPEELQEMIPRFTYSWARKDYNAAGEWLGELEPSPIKDDAISRFAAAVVLFDPEASAIWSTQIQDEWKRSLSLRTSIRNWRQANPEAAQQWLEENGLDPADSETDWE